MTKMESASSISEFISEFDKKKLKAQILDEPQIRMLLKDKFCKDDERERSISFASFCGSKIFSSKTQK